MKKIQSYETTFSDHKAFQIEIRINEEIIPVGSNTRWTINSEDRNKANRWLIEEWINRNSEVEPI